jgi:hypothetical protein
MCRSVLSCADTSMTYLASACKGQLPPILGGSTSQHDLLCWRMCRSVQSYANVIMTCFAGIPQVSDILCWGQQDLHNVYIIDAFFSVGSEVISLPGSTSGVQEVMALSIMGRRIPLGQPGVLTYIHVLTETKVQVFCL